MTTNVPDQQLICGKHRKICFCSSIEILYYYLLNDIENKKADYIYKKVKYRNNCYELIWNVNYQFNNYYKGEYNCRYINKHIAENYFGKSKCKVSIIAIKNKIKLTIYPNCDDKIIDFIHEKWGTSKTIGKLLGETFKADKSS